MLATDYRGFSAQTIGFMQSYILLMIASTH